MDAERFERCRSSIVGSIRQGSGIGTYQEKTLHAVLKDYYAPAKDMQEISVGGYVADIFTGSEIMEIQTGSLAPMRKKLQSLLGQYPITVVYPIPRVKYLSWIDENTGECSKPRKSTVKGSVYRAFSELYKIKPFLHDPNLRLCFPYLEIREYRLLNGWSRDKKKGSMRYDRIPAALLDEIRINSREDYFGLIPDGLPERFTAKDFGEQIRERKEIAALVLNILHDLDVVERCGRYGRYYLYRISGTDF